MIEQNASIMISDPLRIAARSQYVLGMMYASNICGGATRGFVGFNDICKEDFRLVSRLGRHGLLGWNCMKVLIKFVALFEVVSVASVGQMITVKMWRQIRE